MTFPSDVPMTHVSLFSGIGGLDLAAHWAGFETVQFVEKDPFCQSVLRKNFPGVPIHDEITTFDGKPFRGRTDLVSGGFPCQDVSQAARNTFARGIEGEASGLFWQARRIVSECAPSWVLFENVYHIQSRGLDRIKACLEKLAYKVQVLCMASGSCGAPHQRARIFVVGYADSNRKSALRINAKVAGLPGYGGFVPYDEARALALRMDDGVPNRVDRLRALGNAVVPQQAFPILKAIADQLRQG